MRGALFSVLGPGEDRDAEKVAMRRRYCTHNNNFLLQVGSPEMVLFDEVLPGARARALSAYVAGGSAGELRRERMVGVSTS